MVKITCLHTTIYTQQFTQTLKHSAHVCTFWIHRVFVDTKAFICNMNMLLAIKFCEDLICR